MNNENKAQDLTIYYETKAYEIIENLLNKENTNIVELQFMLALLGLKNHNRVDLSKKSRIDSPHTFSLRTMYARRGSDYDTYIGYISILNNLNKPYHKVVNGIAFERTSYRKKKFLDMNNVKTYFEYMLGGIYKFKEMFLSEGTKEIDVVDVIHDYIMNNNDEINDLVEKLLIEESL